MLNRTMDLREVKNLINEDIKDIAKKYGVIVDFYPMMLDRGQVTPDNSQWNWLECTLKYHIMAVCTNTVAMHCEIYRANALIATCNVNFDRRTGYVTDMTQFKDKERYTEFKAFNYATKKPGRIKRFIQGCVYGFGAANVAEHLKHIEYKEHATERKFKTTLTDAEIAKRLATPYVPADYTPYTDKTVMVNTEPTGRATVYKTETWERRPCLVTTKTGRKYWRRGGICRRNTDLLITTIIKKKNK